MNFKIGKVLVHDEDIDISQIIKIILSMADYEVLEVGELDKLLSEVEAHRPDVLILDFKLKGEIVTDICLEIKRRFSNIPVIAMSTNADLGKIYLEKGFDDYFTKPFDMETLYYTVSKHIKKSKSD